MVHEQVGHEGGPFAKKIMVYEQEELKGGPFAKKIMEYEQVGTLC